MSSTTIYNIVRENRNLKGLPNRTLNQPVSQPNTDHYIFTFWFVMQVKNKKHWKQFLYSLFDTAVTLKHIQSQWAVPPIITLTEKIRTLKVCPTRHSTSQLASLTLTITCSHSESSHKSKTKNTESSFCMALHIHTTITITIQLQTLSILQKKLTDRM